MKRLFTVALTFVFGPGAAWAQAPDFDQMIDRAIAQENSLLKVLRGERPLAETYIQELEKDSDFGTVPKRDHYFLGKVDLSHGVSTSSFIPKSDVKTSAFQIFTHLFSVSFLPRGFAQMMLIDGGQFDRAHYDFEFVRRDFLGDVRTWVVEVKPRKEDGPGRFVGQMWVEDKGYNIVRFNGTYGPAGKGSQFYMHFDSWRLNCGPDLWIPYEIYTEESDMPYAFGLRTLRVKAVTRLWGYTSAAERSQGEFTNMMVEMDTADKVEDKSDDAADNSPVESLRAWERQGEENILGKLERAGMLAPAGEVDKVLDTVVNNLVVTNNLNIAPEVRTRVLLTTPLESFDIGHTIVISRGLLDTLPDEASLAAILAHELAHIALGQQVDTRFAFADRVEFDDQKTLERFRFARPQSEEDLANTEALKLLENSPYKDKLSQAGLFLKALGNEANRLPSLIRPLFGSRMADGNNVLRMSALLQSAPQLQTTRTDQVAALPLGSRVKLDPWSDELKMARIRVVPLLSAREKMPFELTPVYLHLTYEKQPPAAIGSVVAAQ